MSKRLPKTSVNLRKNKNVLTDELMAFSRSSRQKAMDLGSGNPSNSEKEHK